MMSITKHRSCRAQGTEERPLLSVRVDVNERDEDNLTPLHLAILNGHIQCVQGVWALDCQPANAQHARRHC